MTGKEIVEIIKKNKRRFLARFAAQFDDMEGETVTLGTHLILTDTALLQECNNGDDLEEKVLIKAKDNGSYAGMEYNDEDFTSNDGDDVGLSWVCFVDLWTALEQASRDVK